MPIPTPDLSTQDAVSKFVRMVEQSRSANTSTSYAKGLRFYCLILQENGLDEKSLPANQISEDSLIWLLDALKDYSPATEQLYTATVTRFFNFLVAEKISDINLSRAKEIVRMRSRRLGQRLPQFPRNEIEQIIDFVLGMPISATEPEIYRDLRDKAFLIMLADTGLRVHEACNLRRGDIDWNEGRAIIIGKGNKQAVVRFSKRSMTAIKDYLKARSKLDGSSGRSMTSLPLFARHDKGAGKKIKPISPTTGRNIVDERIRQVLGDEAKGKITPHSFRHYFVTTVLRASGNLKLAQELARHANIAVTQRYAHISDDELDQGYFEIFDAEK
ncbi:MAG: tyrosine-type recombinase/integrase [Chloroflexi bacterium]|nr:tyrosine-type recombinase/integrase [Chloroflexota bacterium]